MDSVVARILHLSDLHLTATGETIPSVDPLTHLATLLGEIIDRRLAVDACIITGDLAHHAEEAGYQRLRALLNSCPWPTRVLPGNHDDPEVAREALGLDVLPAEKVWQWQVTASCQLLGVDTSVAGHHHGQIDATELAVLETFAAGVAGETWLVGLHHPPLDVGHWWMDAQGLLEGGRSELLRIVDLYNATAILCGHLHIHSTVHRDGRTPMLVAPSVAHEVIFDDGHERPMRFRRRSPRALLHQVHAGGLTTVEITTGGDSWLVDGRPWLQEVARTNRRGPAPH